MSQGSNTARTPGGENEGRIAAGAAGQHGILTFRQLLEAGLSHSAIHRRVRSGRFRALHRGVYLVVPFALPRSREMAAVLASAPAAVLSHASAAALWGMHAVGANAPVDVSVDGNRGHHAGIRVHRVPLASTDRAVKEGIPVTPPARTLADLACVLGVREVEAAVARAEREGLVTGEELSVLLARRRGHQGARKLRAVLRLAGGPALTRSAAEERLLSLVREAALPAPECNVSVGQYEVDLLWRRAGIAVEVDGFRYHASRPRFEADRRRDARLLADGITVVRLSWRQITEQALATAVQLGLALARRGGHDGALTIA